MLLTVPLLAIGSEYNICSNANQEICYSYRTPQYSLPPIIVKVPSRGPETISCRNPQSYDEANLCVQRQMLKASKKQVTWSRVAGIIGIITTTVVVIALWYNIYSTKANVSSARAAKISAEAAVKSLDKPWLFLNKPIQNKIAFVNGLTGLAVVLSLRNYGKAPAVVHSIKAKVFLGKPRGGNLKDLGFGNELPFSALDFPVFSSHRDIEVWLFDKGSELKTSDGSVMIEETQKGERMNIGYVSYDVPFVVAPGESSEKYCSPGDIPIVIRSSSIPIQYAMSVYFIGSIIYESIEGKFESINFCYESCTGREMKVFRGPPYNDRRTLPDWSYPTDRQDC